MKRKLALMLALCLLLAGCSPVSMLPARDGTVYELPAPTEDIPAAAEDYTAPRQIAAACHFLSPDRRALIGEGRTLSVSGEDRAEALMMEALLSRRTPDGLLCALPEGAALRSLTLSGGVATVDLSLQEGLDDAQALLTLQGAVANTLCSLPGVQAVNLLVNGQKLALRGVPDGAVADRGGDLTALWAQLLADEEVYTAQNPITRTAAIWYAGRGGQRIACQLREITFTRQEIVQALLTAMTSPSERTGEQPAGTESDLQIQEPQLYSAEGGEQLVRLVFDQNLQSILAARGIEPWQFCAAVTWTLTGFVPELSGVVIYQGEGLITRVDAGEDALEFENGVMRRADFDGLCGECVTLCLPGEDGLLHRVSRLADPQEADSARQCLTLLLQGPEAWEAGGGILPAVPEGVTKEDLLAVRVEQGEAIVNLSGGFYTACQTLSGQEAQRLAYAIVNTLTALPYVRRVRFQREGAPVDYLAGSVYLRSPLLRNPGLMAPEY